MYGLAYVLIPTDFTALQAELDRSLAPFKRGGEDDFPIERLEFDDWTAELEELWRADLEVEHTARGTSYGHPTAVYTLDVTSMRRFMETLGVDRWRGRLCDVEPDYGAFVQAFTEAPLDPRTGRYGRWLNPLGRWDWWELGGRFEGVTTGERRPARDDGLINSGPSEGRAMVGQISRVLADALGSEVPEDTAEIETNVELAETVLRRLRDDPDGSWPTTVVRPAGSAPDGARWIDDGLLRPSPVDTRLALGLEPDATHIAAKLAALERNRDAAVAGVAYHF